MVAWRHPFLYMTLHVPTYVTICLRGCYVLNCVLKAYCICVSRSVELAVKCKLLAEV